VPDIGASELLIILAIVVVLFGSSKIPEIMGGMGHGIREFRASLRDDPALDRDRTPVSGDVI
jgi:sec-independent protein translocase protein TatA